MNKSFLLLLALAALAIFSCKKNSFNTSKDAFINFSSDTLFFDTVFTTTGSITQPVKIINSNNQKIKLTSVRLMGGANSVFKINIDGASTTEADNIELDANDSIYVFVAVYINPSTANLPFILQDSIQVAFNGKQQYIQLQAWGQNAHFMRNQVITSNTIWPNDLPYVIQGGLQVDTNATLTIQQGCKIYLHADAPLLVDGTLQVQGTSSSRIYFSGDRLDDPYSSYPGSWPGIIFRGESKNNNFEFAVIKNAYQGIVAAGPSINNNPKVTLDECIIDNVYDAGILAIQTNLYAQNCLISNCGKNIELTYGGNYNFIHCTAASYSNDYITHTQPVLYITNISLDDNISVADINANFTNCIFWGDNGSVNDEVVVSKQGSSAFTLNFNSCLWKVQDQPSPVNSAHILTTDPMFDSVNNQKRYYDFHLKPLSPAVNYGVPTSVTIDLDGNPRPVGLPDLGCYENQ